MFDSPLTQPLFRPSLVFLLVLDPLLHTFLYPYRLLVWLNWRCLIVVDAMVFVVVRLHDSIQDEGFHYLVFDLWVQLAVKLCWMCMLLQCMSVATYYAEQDLWSGVRPSVLSVPSIDSSNGCRRVCCWTPRGRRYLSIAYLPSHCRQRAASAGCHQQMQLVSCRELTKEAQHSLFCISVASNKWVTVLPALIS